MRTELLTIAAQFLGSNRSGRTKECPMRSNFRAVALALGFCVCAFANATVQVFNGDPPNQGFNDPTPAAPVGGNAGTTVGRHRQIAFQFAANTWGQTLTSSQIIRVLAFITPLP